MAKNWSNTVTRQADLELGSWLDYHNGREGAEDGAFQHRVHMGDWSVFERS